MVSVNTVTFHFQSESRGPSSVAIRAVAEEVYREMSAMFDAGRSKIANVSLLNFILLD